MPPPPPAPWPLLGVHGAGVLEPGAAALARGAAAGAGPKMAALYPRSTRSSYPLELPASTSLGPAPTCKLTRSTVLLCSPRVPTAPALVPAR